MPSPGAVLVFGGAHSCKSEWAEHLARSHGGAVTYVATGASDLADADWQERLRRHRQRRPGHWALVECGAALPAALERTRGEPLRLVDALGTWVSALLHQGDHHWQQEVEQLLLHLPPRCGTTILVSEEVGCGVVPATAAGYRFRERLARLNRRVAGCCQGHWLVAAGRAIDLATLGHPVPALEPRGEWGRASTPGM